MSENIKKLMRVVTDESMTEEGRASVLAYARGRLDAQRELGRQTADVSSTKAADIEEREEKGGEE